MLLPESSYCPACNSFCHTPNTCPKTLPKDTAQRHCPKTLPTYQRISNALIGPATSSQDQSNIGDFNGDLSLGLRLRSILANGIGNEGRRCNKHRSMQLQMLCETPPDRHAYVPIVLDTFDDSCIVPRTLLPICSTCVQAETGLEETALPSGLDMCRRATMLARAACPNCVLGQINGALKYDVLTRTKLSTKDACETPCKCGNVITADETGRQRVYCCGIAMTPFHGYGGQMLKFEGGAKAPLLLCERQMPEGKTQQEPSFRSGHAIFARYRSLMCF
jgi:hypothetical protein